MKYIISFIGKSKTTDEDIITKKYLKRLNNVVIKQHEVKTNNIKLKMMEEGSKLIKATPLNGKLILLDEQGENLSSNDLAKLILEWEENNVSIVNFAIGGAYGNGEEIKKKADKIIAFGRQTWPHQMVKMMVAEQVYRIDTLLKGHPYHK
jgi:23S rRNA (pseudouridine1915-N3)-methyltransferase